MRSLVVSTFLTLDGVMQSPGGPEEDPTGGFAQGGWSVNYWDEAMGAAMDEDFAKPFDLLLGRKTYEIFAAHWPHVGDEERAERGGSASDVEDAGAAALNSAKKYVASRTLDRLEWNNSELLEGDVAEAVAVPRAPAARGAGTRAAPGTASHRSRHTVRARRLGRCRRGRPCIAGDHVYGLGRADLCLGIEDHDAQLGALRQVA
jgi:dihydrofolate reductase